MQTTSSFRLGRTNNVAGPIEKVVLMCVSCMTPGLSVMPIRKLTFQFNSQALINFQQIQTAILYDMATKISII